MSGDVKPGTVDRAYVDKAFDIAFRGESDGIDDAMAQLFADHASRLLARIEVLEGAVNRAIGWFEGYAVAHAAKGTPDGADKARRNQERANELISAYQDRGE